MAAIGTWSELVPLGLPELSGACDPASVAVDEVAVDEAAVGEVAVDEAAVDEVAAEPPASHASSGTLTGSGEDDAPKHHLAGGPQPGVALVLSKALSTKQPQKPSSSGSKVSRHFGAVLFTSTIPNLCLVAAFQQQWR